MASEESSRRRLPKWMMMGIDAGASASANSITSSVFDIEEDKNKKKKILKEKKPTIKKTFLPSTSTSTSNSSFSLSKQQKTKRSNVKDDDGDGDDLAKKRKPKNSVFATVNNHHDDEADLTVEDLVTIAQEYVAKLNDDDDDDDSHLNLPLDNNPKLPTDDNNNDHAPHQATPSSSSLNLTTQRQQQSLINNINVSNTGDPAHDMLHLFLGPLLNRPLEEENNDINKTKPLSLTEDIMRGLVSHEFKYQSQKNENKNDARQQQQQLQNLFPSSKKKTSLKNKVSLLLD